MADDSLVEPRRRQAGKCPRTRIIS